MVSALNQRPQATSAHLLGIFAGRSAPLGPGKVPSAFVKNTVQGVIHVGRMGLEGDERADLRVHGGPDMALYAYAVEHYKSWNSEFPEHASIWGAGALGENLTFSGWDEADVCVGDTVRLGNVLLQVTRPRKPCFKLALRFNDLRLPRCLVESGRCGWYYRVLQAGSIAANEPPTGLKIGCSRTSAGLELANFALTRLPSERAPRETRSDVNAPTAVATPLAVDLNMNR